MVGLDIRRVKVKVEQLFNDKLDMSDCVSKPKAESEKVFLSRRLAAYALYILASTDEDIAAASVVDGFEDNGIDAIFYDRNQKKLWLIQSKWLDKAIGDLDNGDVRKFTGGVKDLIEAHLERFNSKVQRKEVDISEALDDATVHIELVIAYTGHGFSAHNQRVIDDLLAKLNETEELASFQTFSLNEAYQSLVAGTANRPIDIDVALSNWGHVDEPYKAYYGLINAADIAHWWLNHRRNLFSDNVRNFLGNTEVNREIVDTIRIHPENFLYFNNGITVLCKSISKKPIGGGDRAAGYFECEGVSIVNGAQTVACIGEAHEKFPEKAQLAKVFVRFISLENCPEDFDTKITIATNTQNRIEKRDFVALDPQQDRLRIELALEDKTYHYKRTDEKPPVDDKNCDLEEATIALACANPDVTHAVQVKREIGRLWEDTAKSPYTELFNPKVTAPFLWRSVQVLRDVNGILKSKELSSTGREKSIYIHANRLLLHLVFAQIDKEKLYNPKYDFDLFRQNEIEQIVNPLIEQVIVQVAAKYPESLIHQIFRNFTKCKELKATILAES